MNCSQCGKPAVLEWGGNPLCVGCASKLQAVIESRDRMLKEQVNYLVDQMEAVSGVYGVSPRYEITQPVIHSGPAHFHNIRVEGGSIVGAINTGEVHKIDVALSHIQMGGNQELQRALSSLTEAIITAPDLESDPKNEVLEQLAVVAEEAAKPSTTRRKGLLRSLVSSLNTTLNSVASIVTLWTAVHPQLQRLFG